MIQEDYTKLSRDKLKEALYAKEKLKQQIKNYMMITNTKDGMKDIKTINVEIAIIKQLLKNEN